MYYDLDGAPPGVNYFSTYGHTLSQLKDSVNDAAGYPILCYSGTYGIPDPANDSPTELINNYNAELNGLSAQYSILHDMYIKLLNDIPSDNSGNLAMIEAYMSTVASTKADIDNLYLRINDIATILNNYISSMKPEQDGNNAAISANVATLLQKISDMSGAFVNINKYNAENDPKELEGNYEVADVKTKSIFMRYIFYILFALFVAGCLIFLYVNPTESKLDMFILALGVIILIYYIYAYFQEGGAPS